ncbi:MAG: hypothetical protein AAF367_06095 [Pseudomonadota bacterium]
MVSMWLPPILVKRLLWLAFLLAVPVAGMAHVSEMGLVLLLPTEIYMSAGVWAVGLTVAALALLPGQVTEGLFRSFSLIALRLRPAVLMSTLSAIVLLALIWAGMTGARDPLSNPLPLTIWTIWWIGLVLAQVVFGNIWHWLNPWTGPHRLLAGDGPPPLALPAALGQWPGSILLILFTMFALADPAPDDPARLALITAAYWAISLAGVMLFGPAWLTQCEFVTILMRLMASLAPFGISEGRLRCGMPGWRLLAAPISLSAGSFALIFLAVGSFDGLNETFWWLGFIDVNPLEFPGRSAIIAETVGGLIGVLILLFIVFAGCVALGSALARGGVRFSRAFAALAPTVLPIAVAYHFAHYLTAAMVNGQYALVAVTDPLGTGADWLGLGAFYVSTGFLNTSDSVEAIFQAQAGSVVAGHVLSVILAHAVAMRLHRDRWRATVSQIPLALFMLAYTFIGLWLLAAPKGA